MGDTLMWEKESVEMERVEEVKRKSGGKESRFGKRYGFEIKFRCVKLRLEEGFPVPLLSKEAGVSKSAIHHWVKAYQERGEGGLRGPGVFSKKPKKLPGPVGEFAQAVHFRSKPGDGPPSKDYSFLRRKSECPFNPDSSMKQPLWAGA